jgi:hypothetical protein
LRCEGSGDSSKCTVDEVDIGTRKNPNFVSRADVLNSGKVTEAQLTRVEGNMRRSYMAAQALGKNTTTVKGNAKLGIKDVHVSGDRLVMILQDQKLRASNHRYTDGRGNEHNYPATSNKAEGITSWGRGLNAPKNAAGNYLQTEIGIHEPLHFVPYLLPWDKYPKEHHGPFRDAVEEVIGPHP